MEVLHTNICKCYRKRFLESILKFNELLNQNRFFEAHEVLEGLWKESKKDSSKQAKATTMALKGLINASIAFEHLKRDKPKSKRVSKKAFRAYKKHLILIKESDFEDILRLSKKEIDKISYKLKLEES
jgi:hypothetical protein